MKLLVISAAYPPHHSGEATNAFFLCQNLAERGIDVHVLTSEGCTPHAHPRISLHPDMKRWSWFERPRLARAMERCAPDAVLMVYIGWVYNYEFMPTFAPTLCKKVLPGVPFVTRFENAMGAEPRHTSLLSRAIRKVMAFKEGNGSVNYGYGTLLRDSDRIIVLSERHRAILTDVYPQAKDKMVLVPPPPNMRLSSETAQSARARGRQRLGISDDAFVMTYLGYLHAGKGLENLLRAFAQVRAQGRNVRLVLMGGAIAEESGNPASYVDTLHALAGQLGVSEAITWTGAYTWESDDTSVLLRAADVGVLPFRQGVHLNNSSFASLAAHHLPIITTRGDLLEEQFEHGTNTYLCEPDNTNELATAIATLMDEPAYRERLRSGIERMARDWFSWESALDRTLAACNATRKA